MTTASLTINVLVFLAGIITGAALSGTSWARRFVLSRAGHTGGQEVPAMPTPEARRQRRRLTLLAVLVLGFLMFVGFGIQQSVFQHQRKQHDECVNAWGRDYVRTSMTRTRATQKVDSLTADRDAVAAKVADWERKRDNAVDRLVEVIIASNRTHNPLSQTQAQLQFNAALATFARVKPGLVSAQAILDKRQLALDAATRDLGATRRENPLPVLRCN